MKTIAKKTTAYFLALCVMQSTQLSHAMSMNEVFDKVNANGNTTSPAILQGQTMNMATGGSVFMRIPKRTYNLAQVTPPSWGAGCGGIDLYMGGFGFINKDQFVSMARNIGSNALGYGFKLALQNLCPTCDNVMQALQTSAQQINRLNIDSCEAAKGIVNASTATLDLRGRENAAMNFGVDGNIFGNLSEAWSKVKGNQQNANNAANQAAATKPEINDHRPTGNVVWKALKKMQGIDDEYRQILMAMIGTTVFKDGSQPKAYMKRINGVTDLIGSRDGNSKISVSVYACADGYGADQCTELVPAEISKDSFYAMVGKRMNEVINNIADRKAYSNTNDLIAFLNVTDIPVYKMLAVSTRFNNKDYALTLMGKYQELIAAKYAQAYLEGAVRDLRAALDSYKDGTSDPAQEAILRDQEAQLQAIVDDARSTMMDAHSRTISAYNIGLEVQHLERTLNSNLSQTLSQSLAFGQSLK